MANPQKENGHIDIANEIGEALARTNLNKYESRYLWALWRKTYGWHKKEDIISNSQFVELTGIKKQHIWRTQQRLIQRKIVTKTGNKIAFQKDYTNWRELPKQVTVTQTGIPVTYSGIKVTQIGGHKRNYTKESETPSVLLENSYKEKFKEIIGKEPIIDNYPKCRAFANTRIKQVTLEICLNCVPLFFEFNKWYKEKGYDYWTFLNEINKLRLKL